MDNTKTLGVLCKRDRGEAETWWSKSLIEDPTHCLGGHQRSQVDKKYNDLVEHNGPC